MACCPEPGTKVQTFVSIELATYENSLCSQVTHISIHQDSSESMHGRRAACVACLVCGVQRVGGGGGGEGVCPGVEKHSLAPFIIINNCHIFRHEGVASTLAFG